MPTPDHPQELLEELLDGQADELSRAALMDALRGDAALRAELRLHLEMSDSLGRLKTERQDENFVRSAAGHAMAVGAEQADDFVNGLTRRISRRTWARRLAVAAVITLAATGAFVAYRPSTTSAVVASMIELDDQGRVIARHDITPGYHHAPQEGLFRLNFSNGAVVAVEAPADFRIESAMKMRLHSGKLNAWCPESAHGFQVATATGMVTDLGTSFGVSTHRNGASEFLVLDGLIEVSQGKETRRLEEGQAVRTARSAGIEDLAFEATPFARTWPLASGIIATHGSVKPAPPGTAEQLSKLESNDTVLVIPEKRNVIFDQSFQAEITEPGTFSSANASQLHVLREDPEKRLRSFLVRFNPVYDFGFKRFDGAVTFDRPVLGICCQGKYLDATDGIFATGAWTDVSEEARQFRGIDLNQPSGYPEQVTLSEDRRTVTIVFNAGVSSDDIRVILEED
ncbi:hypothetical protein OVA24_07505 [Luteolibacter sp. SL250]|uniref:hypothetical protein n=1 Tax=Luteolibacter sp. SL250 TaxID=2995170 RepID=UPI00226EC5F2|nr:hypothetical protein [Luteolibacter sp. SL250]WAC21228.1 hypothetical protein OVA24_07505 [Luteolibacter sp. SL250]